MATTTTTTTTTTTPSSIIPLTYLDETGQTKEIECNTTLENFGLLISGRPYTVKFNSTIEECIQPATNYLNYQNLSAGKFYLSKPFNEERCNIWPIQETSKGKLVKENGTVTFLYCHHGKV